MKPQEIEQLLQLHGGGETAEDSDDAQETPEATRKRTELLQDVLISCQQALESNGDELQGIAEVLGNGSRDGETTSLTETCQIIMWTNRAKPRGVCPMANQGSSASSWTASPTTV